MPVNNQELLIDHLDKKLQGQSIPEAEALLLSDSNAREEWQYLQAAVDAVEHTALQARVAAIGAEMARTATVPMPATMPAGKPVVRSITSKLVRVAAAIVLLIGSLVVYKFATVNANDFYTRHYTTYELPTSRGGADIKALDEAYRNGDWNAVTSLYNSQVQKSNHEHFLAGIAALELKQFPAAIERFSLVIRNNAGGTDTYFNDEAEYYLALAYIASNDIAKATALLDKIKADSNHPYREKAAGMSGTDLKVLELK